MNSGSTEVYVALKTVLRDGTLVSVKLPQREPFDASVSAVSRSYADLNCQLGKIPDNQLGLIRIAFPFQGGLLEFTTTGGLQSAGCLRINIDTSGHRDPHPDLPSLQALSNIFQRPSRLPISRLPSLLTNIRQAIPTEVEHKISILPAPADFSQPHVQLAHMLPHAPGTFCLPIDHSADPSPQDIRISAALPGILCGWIEIIGLPHAQLPDFLSRMSICALAIAHTLLLPTLADSSKIDSMTLLDSPGGKLVFLAANDIASDKYPNIKQISQGFSLDSPLGTYTSLSH